MRRHSVRIHTPTEVKGYTATLPRQGNFQIRDVSLGVEVYFHVETDVDVDQWVEHYVDLTLAQSDDVPERSGWDFKTTVSISNLRFHVMYRE